MLVEWTAWYVDKCCCHKGEARSLTKVFLGTLPLWAYIQAQGKYLVVLATLCKIEISRWKNMTPNSSGLHSSLL